MPVRLFKDERILDAQAGGLLALAVHVVQAAAGVLVLGHGVHVGDGEGLLLLALQAVHIVQRTGTVVIAGDAVHVGDAQAALDLRFLFSMVVFLLHMVSLTGAAKLPAGGQSLPVGWSFSNANGLLSPYQYSPTCPKIQVAWPYIFDKTAILLDGAVGMGGVLEKIP